MRTLAEIILAHGDQNDGTEFPFWFVAQKSINGRIVILSHGFWFSRKAAEDHLTAKRYNYPKTAYIWCGSGHASQDVREMYELAKSEVSK